VEWSSADVSEFPKMIIQRNLFWLVSQAQVSRVLRSLFMRGLKYFALHRIRLTYENR
jgi:hypothetical protein